MNAHTQSRHSVVVGVDGSEEAQRALHWAAGEAGRRHWPLRVIHALDYSHFQLKEVIGAKPGSAEDREVAQTIVDEAVAAVERIWPAVGVTGDWRRGNPAPVLARTVTEHDILVVGSRGLGRVASALLGSVSSDVSYRADCPVIVVRETTSTTHSDGGRGVILGVDGSSASVAATAFAFEEASLRSLPLTVVHAVWEPYTDSQAVVAVLTPTERTVVDASERLDVAETIAGWREQCPDVGVVTRYENGRPDRVLTNFADTAELLVVGAHGRGATTAMHLGSVSRRVLRSARCPIAVVRQRSRREVKAIG